MEFPLFWQDKQDDQNKYSFSPFLDQDGEQDAAICNDENMLDNHHGTVTLLFNRTNVPSIPGDLNNDGNVGSLMLL